MKRSLTLVMMALVAGLLPGWNKAEAAATNAEPAPAKSGPGFSYRHEEVPEIPWSIYIVKVARSNPDFQVHSLLGGGSSFGLATVRDQATAFPTQVGKPVAAMNGDYYDNEEPYVGDPKGLQISRGELISGPADWTCLWIDSEQQPHMGVVSPKFMVTWPGGETTKIGLNERRAMATAVLYNRTVGASTHTEGGRELVLERPSDAHAGSLHVGEEFTARVREVREAGDTPIGQDVLVLSISPELARRTPKVQAGAMIKVSLATTPDIKGAVTALSGGPVLVREGKPQLNGSQLRHPRSAVGWNKDYIYFVVVDGRRVGISVGMTYSEIANYMAKLGCDDAMNLDGGGSVTMWVRGTVVNTPSEGKERGVANSLAIIQRPKPQEAAPAPAAADPGAR